MSLRMRREGTLLEGFEVITSRTKDRVTYEAPDLNFFALAVIETCQYKTIETCGIFHRDVQVGEQEPALFLPPHGEEIRELAQPGGIVRIGEP